jgi:hypothetical protein
VQHVQVHVDARDAPGRPIPARTRDPIGNPNGGPETQNMDDDYLEGWRVDSTRLEGGQVRAGEDATQQGGDTFQINPEAPGTYGRVTIRGKARFFNSSHGFPDEKSAKWNWPSRGFPNHKKDPTYTLPSTRDPGEIRKFDADPNAADHWMVYEWDTRDPDPKKHVHRRYGGLGVPPPNLPPVK